MQDVFSIKDRGTQVMDLAAFTLKKGVTEQQLFEAHERVRKDFFSTVKGFVSIKLLYDGTKYYDLTVYESLEAAKAAAEAFMESFAPELYSNLIDAPTDAEIPVFHILKNY